MLEQAKGGLNGASSATDALSQAQEANAARAAAMSQAHSELTKTLASAESQGRLTAAQVTALTSAVQNNTGQVDTSKGAFEAFAGQLGISKTAADTLWTSLKNVAGDYLANIKVNASGGGTISVQEMVTVANAPANAAQAAQNTLNNLTHAARGAYIVKGSGPAGKDSVLAMLAPGELVIPTGHAARFADQAKKAGIPGFAAGGLISASVTGNPNSGGASATTAKYAEPTYAQSIATSTGNAVAAQLHFADGGLVPGFADGGTITEPVYGSVNSIPASFGGSSQLAQAIPVATGAGQQAQPMTQVQGMLLIQLIQQLVKLGQQQPEAYARALNSGLGQGARRAFFQTGGL
jgi:hypothetical protein